MRALGLDIGTVRVGVAISDPSGTVASPVGVLDARRLREDAAELRAIVEQHGVGVLVVGLPVTMAGEAGPQAHAVTKMAESLGQALGLPVEYVDERLTTAQASAALRASGMRTRAQRGKVDAVAAALVLQTYLDSSEARRRDGS